MHSFNILNLATIKVESLRTRSRFHCVFPAQSKHGDFAKKRPAHYTSARNSQRPKAQLSSASRRCVSSTVARAQYIKSTTKRTDAEKNGDKLPNAVSRFALQVLMSCAKRKCVHVVYVCHCRVLSLARTPSMIFTGNTALTQPWKASHRLSQSRCCDFLFRTTGPCLFVIPSTRETRCKHWYYSL